MENGKIQLKVIGRYLLSVGCAAALSLAWCSCRQDSDSEKTPAGEQPTKAQELQKLKDAAKQSVQTNKPVARRPVRQGQPVLEQPEEQIQPAPPLKSIEPEKVVLPDKPTPAELAKQKAAKEADAKAKEMEARQRALEAAAKTPAAAPAAAKPAPAPKPAPATKPAGPKP